MREAFHIAASGRPGPVLIDITKDAQQSSCDFDWEAAAPKPHARPESVVNSASVARALELINTAAAAADPRRPRHHPVERHRRSSGSSRSGPQIPIAMTLLGIGGVPGLAPRSTSA